MFKNENIHPAVQKALYRKIDSLNRLRLGTDESFFNGGVLEPKDNSNPVEQHLYRNCFAKVSAAIVSNTDGDTLSSQPESLSSYFTIGQNRTSQTNSPLTFRKSFEETLERSDFISLHCPLTQENFHMIDKMALKRMKSSAFLINTARGGLINSDHLLEALSSGEIAGAALDVLETEPPRNNEPLSTVKMPNLIISPHVAWSAIESRKRLVEQTQENIKSFLRGRPIRLVI